MCVILYDVLFQNQHILDQLLKDPGIAEALTPKVSFDWLILTQISISPLVLREQTDYSELVQEQEPRLSSLQIRRMRSPILEDRLR
jgi:hypothetical protein